MVIPSTGEPVDRERLEQHLCMYRFDELLDVEALSPSSLHHSLLVRVADWEAPKALELVVFTGLKLEELPLVVRLTAHLMAAAIPATPALVTLDGMTTAIFQRRPSLLFQVPAGAVPAEATAPQCRAAGRLLAELHGIAYPHPTPRSDRLVELMRGLQGPESPMVATAGLAGAASRLAGAWDRLPRGLCHRNPIRANVRFEGERLSALKDLFWAGQDCLALDLALMLADWCDGSLNGALADALLAGYGEQRQLTGLEQDLLPDLIRLAAWALRHQNGQGPAD